MKHALRKIDRSQVWLLLGYSLCLMTTFRSQHHALRQIATGAAVTVMLLVTLLALRSRWRGCAASTQS